MFSSFRRGREDNLLTKMAEKTVYLDHAGAALPSAGQIEGVFDDLRRFLPTNPHSSHTSSRRTHEMVEQARIRFDFIDLIGGLLPILGYWRIFTSPPTSIR